MSEKYSVSDIPEVEIKKVSAVSVKNITTAILIVCTLIAALVSMGEINLTLTGVIGLSLLCFIIFLIASLVYSTRYEASMEQAKSETDYIETVKAYEEQKEKIYSLGIITRLPELCLKYRENELKMYRSEILSDACISYEVYEKEYKNLTESELKQLNLSPQAIKCIKRARSAKGIRISAQELMSGKRSPMYFRAFAYITPETRQVFDTSLNVISRLVTTLISGAVVISIALEPSLEAVAQWAVRMLPVAFAAISGSIAGRNNIKHTAIPCYVRLTEILKTCIKWSEEEETVQTEVKAAEE